MKRTYIITVICIMLHMLAPQAGARVADDLALPAAAGQTVASSSDTGTSISRTDDNTIIIRIRLPETRTIVYMFIGLLLFVTTAIVLRRRNRHYAQPHRIASDESRNPAAPTAEGIATAVTGSRTDNTAGGETVPAAAMIRIADDSPTAPFAAAAETDTSDAAPNEWTEGIDLPMLAQPSSGDLHMLQRLNEFIARHIGEVELSVNDLSAAVYMSRSNLFRRLKTLYGITPNEYLRRKRLLFAAALLRQNRHTISDVCFMVGFSSPSYFASCFKKHFGVLPKNYIRY